MNLYPYQKDAVDFALVHRRTYMMLDLGLGKTAVALKTIEAVRQPALVLCPVKVGINTWVDEIANWTPQLKYVIFHGPHKDKLLNKKADIYILPYSSLKWFYTRCCQHRFKLRKFTTIFDESTFIKSWSTDRWKKYVRRMLPIFGQYRMCLSATPVPNGLVDLWTQYYVLDQGKTFGHYPTTYRDRYFTYTGAPRYQTYIKPGSEREIYKLIKPITKRLDRNDYLKLPPITYNKVMLTVPPALVKVYRKLKKDSTLEFEDFTTATALNKAGLSSKLRQFAQGALYLDTGGFKKLHMIKAHALKEMVEGLNGKPVLVPIQFRFDYDMICNAFGKELPIIRGGISEVKARRLIVAWNKGKIPVLLCHPQSIGHGLNLQRGGHNIIWYALPWALDHFTQLNGRLDRTGQVHGVVVSVMCLEVGIDTRVFAVLRQKNATQRDLLNAIRGVC